MEEPALPPPRRENKATTWACPAPPEGRSRPPSRTVICTPGSRQGSRNKGGSRCCSREHCGSAGDVQTRFQIAGVPSRFQNSTIGADIALEHLQALHPAPATRVEAASRTVLWPEIENLRRQGSSTLDSRCGYAVEFPHSALGLDSLGLRTGKTSQSELFRPSVGSPQQFNRGDYGHAAAYIARTLSLPSGSRQSSRASGRQGLLSRQLSAPTVPRGATPITSQGPNAIFYAPAFPDSRRSVIISEDVGIKTLVDCIRGLGKDPKLVTTEDITDRLLQDGWLNEELQQILAIGQQRTQGLLQLPSLAVQTKGSTMNSVARAAIADASRRKQKKKEACMPWAVPPLIRSDLPAYLKVQLQMLPAVVTTTKAGECGCLVLMHFADTPTAKVAVEQLRKTIQGRREELPGSRALREGCFVQLIIEDCKRREDVSALVDTLRGAFSIQMQTRPQAVVQPYESESSQIAAGYQERKNRRVTM